jgi:hypothetical protein
MAAINDTVQPGDVISSDLFNRMIGLLNAHEVRLGAGQGGIVVPNLFGRTIAEARVILQLQQLTLGTVVNVFGTLINPSDVGSGSLRVLNQVPVAGAGTVVGASVSLVVPGQSGGTAPVPTTPQINLVVPSTERAGNSIDIRGSGFAGTASSVTFDGIVGTVLGTSSSTRLFVTVPAGIPGAPALPTDPDKPGVVIRVTNPDGASATSTMTLQAPLAVPLAITSISPSTGQVGQPVTIGGTGFAGTASQNVVRFGPQSATPSAGSTTQLTVTVPTGIPGLVTPGDSTAVNVTVTRTTDNAVSGAYPLTVEL